MLPDLRPGRRGGPRLLARVGDLQGRRGPSSSGTRPTASCSSRAAPATCATEPYEKILRDIRIFPIFEGANDVMRAFIALSGMKPVGEKLSELGEVGLGDPIGSIGVLVDYVSGRIQREVRPDRISRGPPGALRARRRGLRSGQGAPRRHRVAPARAQGRDHRAPVPAEAARRLGRRHLRADRRALAGDLDLRGPGRRALRPGALHRRDVLHPRRRPRQRRASSRSSRTTTSGCRRSRSSPTSAASTATRCSRTESYSAVSISSTARAKDVPKRALILTRESRRSAVGGSASRWLISSRSAVPRGEDQEPNPAVVRRARARSPGRAPRGGR